ncbi:MAG TPA: low molecular weight protein arginine phosphatase, partial [Desulfobacteraceae bacterium]|nr:low molecular weight protein arginine phosphatase [Desulfobacteraceae bacterium]
MPRIVFVCTGNICRSPMAEGILRARWREAGRTGLVVSSMGTHGLDHFPAEPLARQVCRENGVDIEAHRSRSLVGDELRTADLVLCMEPAQRRFVQTFFPWIKERIGLLAAWPEKGRGDSVIADPMGADVSVFREVFGRIDNHLERILPKLLALS